MHNNAETVPSFALLCLFPLIIPLSVFYTVCSKVCTECWSPYTEQIAKQACVGPLWAEIWPTWAV